MLQVGLSASLASVAAALARARDVAERSFASAASLDRDDGFPGEEVALLARAGLLAAPLSQARGGLGLGIEPGRTRALLDLLATLGRGNLALARLYEGHVNALQLIQTYGTPAQIADSALAAGRDGKLFGVWNTWDVDAGDGVQIAPAPSGYVLTGAKIFASGAGHVARALVTGSLPDGDWQMCLVPMDEVQTQIDPSSWHPIGMRASASYRVDFAGVALKSGALIGGPGDYFREPLFRGGAIRFAAAQLGGAESLLDQARSYLRLRRAGRRDDPYLQQRIGLAAVALEGGRLWLDSAAALTDAPGADGEGSPGLDEVVAYADMTRTAIERACLDVLELVERSVGARGLLRPSPIERIARDLRLYLRQAASDAALARVGQAVLDRTTPVDCLWHGPELAD